MIFLIVAMLKNNIFAISLRILRYSLANINNFLNQVFTFTNNLHHTHHISAPHV